MPRLKITVSTDEHAQLTAAAATVGLSQSDFVRQCIAEHTGWQWPVLYRKSEGELKPQSVRARRMREKKRGENG